MGKQINVLDTLNLDSFKEFYEEDFVKSTEGEYSAVLNTYLPWAKQNYGDWLKEYQQKAVLYLSGGVSFRNLPDSEVFEAFSRFCGNQSAAMSEADKEIMRQEFQKDVAILKDDIVVHRVTTMSQLTQRCGLKEITEGKILKFPGFLSTSLVKLLLIDDDDFKNKFNVYMRLYAPADSRCLYTEFIGHRFEEQTMLFDENQQIKILDVTESGGITNITGIII